jgi:hypothetical protein
MHPPVLWPLQIPIDQLEFHAPDVFFSQNFRRVDAICTRECYKWSLPVGRRLERLRARPSAAASVEHCGQVAPSSKDPVLVWWCRSPSAEAAGSSADNSLPRAYSTRPGRAAFVALRTSAEPEGAAGLTINEACPAARSRRGSTLSLPGDGGVMKAVRQGRARVCAAMSHDWLAAFPGGIRAAADGGSCGSRDLPSRDRVGMREFLRVPAVTPSTLRYSTVRRNQAT